MSRERWQELDAAAMSGPWEADGAEVYQTGVREWVAESLHMDDDAGRIDEEKSNAVAAFIAAARIGWPAAERECDQLRALLRQVRDEMRGYVTLQRTAELADLITASGLLDDEGQQR